MRYETVETYGRAVARPMDKSKIDNNMIENFVAGIRTTLIRMAHAGGLESIDRIQAEMKFQRKQRRAP